MGREGGGTDLRVGPKVKDTRSRWSRTMVYELYPGCRDVWVMDGGEGHSPCLYGVEAQDDRGV